MLFRSTLSQLQLFAKLPLLMRESGEAHAMHTFLWRTLTNATAKSTTPLQVQPDGFLQGFDEEVYRKVPGAPMRCKTMKELRRYGIDEDEWRRLKLSTTPRPMKECKADLAKVAQLNMKRRPF